MTDVLLLGGSGVLGRALLAHLRARDVVATTRTPAKLDLLETFGARGAVCDVYDTTALNQLAVEAKPEVVVNLLTDLGTLDFAANGRIRREGGPNVVAAAQAAGARRLVVESISFAASDPGAVETLERSARESGLEAVVIRFGILWGPGTWHETEPEDDSTPRVHVDEAGRRAAELLFDAAPGVYVV